MELQSNNLNIFRILYIIKGVLTLLGSLILLGYLIFIYSYTSETNTIPSADIGVQSILAIVLGIGFLICLIVGILSLLAAKYIGQARNYTFVLVVAILSCLSGILGILLGVFTIIEINKPHVKILFDQKN